MAENQHVDIIHDALKEKKEAQTERKYLLFPDLPHTGSLEGDVVEIHFYLLNRIKHKSIDVHKEIGVKQRTANFLSRFISALQASSDEKGDVDLEKVPEIQEWIDAAKQLGVPFDQFGIKLDSKKKKLSFQERMVTVDAIKARIEDLNTEVQLELQRVYNLQTEMHEAYQWMRSHAKILHEIKMKPLREIRGAR